MEIFLYIIVPILIVAALAALFAFFLSYLGDRLAVERDPRIDEIEHNLAGANCGGCGYAGCSQFAEAVFKGEADFSRCNPTSPEGKKNIAAILGVDAGNTEVTVAVVHCAGGVRAVDKYDYRGNADCSSASLLSGGSKACSYGCLGLCSCVGACNDCAIELSETGTTKTDTNKCTSCGGCISACPKHIIGRAPKSAKVYVACNNRDKGKDAAKVCKVSCIACGKCERSCPSGAIKVVNYLAEIDYKQCIGCMKCALDCPRGCLLPMGDGVGELDKLKTEKEKAKAVQQSTK